MPTAAIEYGSKRDLFKQFGKKIGMCTVNHWPPLFKVKITSFSPEFLRMRSRHPQVRRFPMSGGVGSTSSSTKSISLRWVLTSQATNLLHHKNGSLDTRLGHGRVS